MHFNRQLDIFILNKKPFFSFLCSDYNTMTVSHLHHIFSCSCAVNFQSPRLWADTPAALNRLLKSFILTNSHYTLVRLGLHVRSRLCLCSAPASVSNLFKDYVLIFHHHWFLATPQVSIKRLSIHTRSDQPRSWIGGGGGVEGGWLERVSRERSRDGGKRVWWSVKYVCGGDRAFVKGREIRSSAATAGEMISETFAWACRLLFFSQQWRLCPVTTMKHLLKII